MTVYGADVAELRQLAAQFERLAGQLDADRMAVGNAIQISAWVGPFASKFRVEWNSDHSRRIHHSAQLLRNGAQALRSNADDQDRASAVTGVTSAASHGSRSGDDSGEDEGETSNPWQQAIESIREMDWGGLKPWQLAELGATMGDLMEAKTGWFGTLNTGLDVIDIYSGIVDGKPDFAKIIHLGASQLGHAKNPVAKLVALNLHVWTDVAQEFGKADFSSDQLARTGDYVAQNPSVIVEEVGKATLEVGRRLVGWLPL
jgi:hypothetical protein